MGAVALAISTWGPTGAVAHSVPTWESTGTVAFSVPPWELTGAVALTIPTWGPTGTMALSVPTWGPMGAMALAVPARFQVAVTEHHCINPADSTSSGAGAAEPLRRRTAMGKNQNETSAAFVFPTALFYSTLLLNAFLKFLFSS